MHSASQAAFSARSFQAISASARSLLLRQHAADALVGLCAGENVAVDVDQDLFDDLECKRGGDEEERRHASRPAGKETT